MKKPKSKLSGIDIGGNFKIVNGRIVKDEKKILSKLDLCKRITRQKSKRVRYKPASNVNRTP